MYDVEDEESMDDPISLVYEGFPEDNMQKSSQIYVVEDDVEDDPISWIENPIHNYMDTDIVDLLSSDEEDDEQHPTPKAGYGNKNFIIPVTFLDFYRNVKLLKKCKPLSIKVVDCDKHPWYYGDRRKSKSIFNANCFTLGKIKQEIKEEKPDKDAVTPENKEVNVETVTTTDQFLNDDKIQDQEKVKSEVNSATLIAPSTDTCVKLQNEPEIVKKSTDLSQVDFRRNSGLVGLTISNKDLDLNLGKVAKKKTRKKSKKEHIVDNTVMQGIGETLNNFGTSVTPVPETRNENVLDNVTKDSYASNVILPDLSCSSNNSDKMNNNTISPTRCSLKITSSAILEKVLKLEKTKSQNAPKPKPQQKPQKIFDKNHAVPKLNLKRKSTSENHEFYVINSNNEPRSNSLGATSHSHEPQKDQNAAVKVIHKKKSVKTYPPAVPSVTITVKDRQTSTPNTSTNADKLDQTQSSVELPTPKPYHKKFNPEKRILNNAPNNITQNQPMNLMCSKTLNNQDINTSDSSLTPGLNDVVVSQVKSLRDTNTHSSNIPHLETPEKTKHVHVSKPKHLKLKSAKNIDTTSANSNKNVNENNESMTRNGDTHSIKVKKSHILQSPSLSYLQVYNAHVLNYYNNLKELSKKHNCKKNKPDKNKPDGKKLKNTEKNSTEQKQTNRSKDTVTVANNSNVVNNDIPNRDTATSNTNLNNTLVPPKTTLNVKRFNSQQQLDVYLYMKQNQLSNQANTTQTVNNALPIKTQVYHLPGNNTVILRKPPAHIQANTKTSGLPIQTVINHRPSSICEHSSRTFTPFSFPPPNTNVAPNTPNYNRPTMSFHENKMYAQYYWQVMNAGHPYLHLPPPPPPPPPPMVVQQDRNSVLIPIRNQESDNSIIGSTANGELIKKINIGTPASDATVVNDKQVMLDTLNNAIKEQKDLISVTSDPRLMSQANRTKPCPLSKKPKMDLEPNKEPCKGYSPPILPIPSFHKAIEILKSKQKAHNWIQNQVEKMDNIEVDTNSINGYCHQSLHDKSKKKSSNENKKQDKAKKISLEEYKKRVSKGGMDVNKVSKHKCKRKKISKNIVVDNNQDLGYDSDATMKL